MRVHVIQVAYGDDEPMAERVSRVADLVTAQRGADLVVLPELWAPGGFAYRTWAERAEELDGPTVTALAQAARRIGAVVHAGSIVEKAPDDAPPEARGETGRGLWNTSVLLGPDGALLASYRKIHRFGFGQGEPALMEAGTQIVTLDLPLGAAVGGQRVPVTVGLATCYDLRFPEMFRLLLDAGARVVLVPAAWPAPRVEAWQLLGRARAIENQVALVQCNTGGSHGGLAMGGHSQVLDAAGRVLAEAGTGEEVLVAEIDVPAIDAWRADFPVLADRRL
ncbi:MAG: carbon-nitrogen family hydrolase [Kineosporiaceae bacterium]|nr:carbon-nitrogen family hydrolase [Kineosporiaceae bacterium]MBK8074374.1 carbon-nitrogen family hydrolase [Kineosporiaceae bacterium]